MWVISIFKGVCVGAFGYIIGIIMDETVSKKSLKAIMDNESQLYTDGMQKVRENMLLITPSVYFISDLFLFNHAELFFRIDKALFLLFFHNVCYYFVHKGMHRIVSLRKYHAFHHKFDKYIVPSIGNAVSTTEFMTAYVAPFILGSLIVNPNEVTFLAPVSLIILFNNIIHSRELIGLKWNKYFVSPKMHIEHHEVRNKHYAAPIVNIDELLEN